jgi:hypothetical protein
MRGWARRDDHVQLTRKATLRRALFSCDDYEPEPLTSVTVPAPMAAVDPSLSRADSLSLAQSARYNRPISPASSVIAAPRANVSR